VLAVVETRESSKQAKNNFRLYRKEPKLNLFQLFLRLFHEIKKIPFSVCFGVQNMYQNNRNKYTCFETEKPKLAVSMKKRNRRNKRFVTDSAPTIVSVPISVVSNRNYSIVSKDTLVETLPKRTTQNITQYLSDILIINIWHQLLYTKDTGHTVEHRIPNRINILKEYCKMKRTLSQVGQKYLQQTRHHC
jgi:hypothetical protein